MLIRKKRSPKNGEEGSPGAGKGSLVLFSVLFAACFFLGIVYHLFEWKTSTTGPVSLQLAYQLVLAVGYASLWMVLQGIFRMRRPRPAKSLWTILLGGIIFLGIGGLSSRIAGPSILPNLEYPRNLIGFDFDTGIPLVLTAIIKLNILALCQIGFAFILVLKLQDLVLVKRSKTSQRNWYLMIGMMLLTSVSVIATPPGESLGEVTAILMIIAVVFMLVNSFRLSWIVFLSFKEKMATIGLTLLLGLLLLIGFSLTGNSILGDVLVPGAHSYLARYNYPIATFASLSVLFGILYSTTGFLSLLFHLPTSGEYSQRAGERATMESLAQLVGRVFDAENLYATIAAAPVEAGSARTSWLALKDFQNGSLTPNLVSSCRIEMAQIEKMVDLNALYDEVHQTRRVLHLEHAQTDHRVVAKPGDGFGSLLITPIIAREEVLGALFATKEVVRGFEVDDIQTIGILSAQAAVAIDNARLFEQQVERERLSRELSIAREVQKKLLPQSVPSIPGLSFAASSDSAQEVGGDYYDFVRLDEHRLGMIIGDVSGKGTSAAFYMAGLQGVFQSVSRLAPSPKEFLSHANTALGHSLDRNVFISVVYGILDTKREEFVIARAGHCPVAVVGQARASRYVRSRGLGLGLDRSSLFRDSLEEETIRLEPGDVYALYTDGLVESRDAAGAEYGYDRLLDTLQRYRHEDADAIHASIMADLSGFAAHGTFDDDMTLLIVKWHGIPLLSLSEKVLEAVEST